MFCCRLLTFQNKLFAKNSFKNAIRVSIGLDPDMNRRSVCPDLGLNCLQISSADNKSRRWQRSTSNLTIVSSIVTIV